MEEKAQNFSTPVLDKKGESSKKKKNLFTVLACVLVAISFSKLSALSDKSYAVNYMKDGSYNTFAPVSTGIEQIGDFITGLMYALVGLAGAGILLYLYVFKGKNRFSRMPGGKKSSG